MARPYPATGACGTRILFTVDTVWEYSGDYSGGIKGYEATTAITAYDIHSGNLLKTLGEVGTSMPMTISVSKDNPPEKFFATVLESSPKLAIIGKFINGYIEYDGQ